MVRLITTAILSIFALATLGLSGPCSHTHTQRSANTIVQIKSDLGNIDTKVGTLQTTADQAKSIADALDCHEQANTISIFVSKTTDDVNDNGKIAQADGEAIITSSKALATKVNETLTTIINKKSVFNSFGLSNVNEILVNDFKDMSEKTDNLWSAFIENFPSDLITDATAIRDEMIESFKIAISMYSSSSA